MMLQFGKRMLTEADPKALFKFGWNFGVKGVRSIELYKKRLARGEHFPPFLFISVISNCNLRCQGCWVDVEGPGTKIEYDELNRIITEAKSHGNSFFGILGGEPFMHPDIMRVFADHPDAYFQVFTNGQFITDEVARELRRLGNVTPLISIEGSEIVSDERRGRFQVLNHTLKGIENCRRNKLIIGIATSVCQSNLELVTEDWLRRLISMGAHYAWFHTYRVVGPKPAPHLALTPEQVLRVRRFIVEMRNKLPIAIVDAYWDDKGEALCPMATGISHHIGPGGHVEPCPIIQFATESIYDKSGRDLFQILNQSEYLKDFRTTSAKATRGCVMLERPDLVRDLVERHGAADTTQRQQAMAELLSLQPRTSQHNPGNAIPEENWMYRFAKKRWFFGFGAYT